MCNNSSISNYRFFSVLIVRKLTRKMFPSFVCLLSIFAHVVKLLFIITPIAKQSYIMNEAPRTVAVANCLLITIFPTPV